METPALSEEELRRLRCPVISLEDDDDSSSALLPAAGEGGPGLGWYSDGGLRMPDAARVDNEEFHDCRGP